MSNLFFSLVSLVIALFFMLIGIVGIIIPWSTNIRNFLTQFISDGSIAISMFGFTFFVIGIAIAINILLNAKRKHYKISSKIGSAEVDETIIHNYLNTYLKQLFPQNDIPCQLDLRENQIHVNVDLPFLPIQEQKPLLERIRKDLIDIFDKVLGYRNEFFLSATFQTHPKQ